VTIYFIVVYVGKRRSWRFSEALVNWLRANLLVITCAAIWRHNLATKVRGNSNEVEVPLPLWEISVRILSGTLRAGRQSAEETACRKCDPPKEVHYGSIWNLLKWTFGECHLNFFFPTTSLMRFVLRPYNNTSFLISVSLSHILLTTESMKLNTNGVWEWFMPKPNRAKPRQSLLLLLTDTVARTSAVGPSTHPYIHCNSVKYVQFLFRRYGD
jgi:hypothetical protein